MYKELLISIILIILITVGDRVTQNYTKKNIEELTNQLDLLEQNLIENQEEIIKETAEQINKKWEEIHNKLAYYIEHDELEKVETYLTACKSFIQTKNYNLATNELEKTTFVLDHITDKYSFNLENIF